MTETMLRVFMGVVFALLLWALAVTITAFIHPTAAAADLRRAEATCSYQGRSFRLGLPTVKGECYRVFGYRLCKV